MKKILLIKHGALGDIVFSLPVMHTIKEFYFNSSIDLLTEKKYINFFRKSNFFHNIIEDNRSTNIWHTCLLLIKLLDNKYDLVIDLQNSQRTTFYNLFFRLFSKTKISSSRKFANFRYHIPTQGAESTTKGLFNQIKLLKIPTIINTQYDWLKINLGNKFKKSIVLFIPGVSKNGDYKQWNPDKFASVALYCENLNYQICLVGTNKDIDSILPIINKCKNIINYIDISPPEVIYSIAQISALVITNDTGPGHIASLSKTNILWIANKNKITKANITKKLNNYLVSSADIKNISVDTVIDCIKNHKLL